MNNLYDFAIDATVILGAIVLLLAAFAVLNRGISDRRQARTRRLQPILQHALQSYLAGDIALVTAKRRLGTDRKQALGALLVAASGGNRNDQAVLRPLFVELGLEEDELLALRHRDPAVRARAAVHLGYMGDQGVAQVLITALQDDQLDVRLCAAQALVQLQHLPAVPAILEALALPGRWPVQRATELIYGMGSPVIAPLQHILDAASAHAPEILTATLNVLGLLRAHVATDRIEPLLLHPSTEVRMAAVRALETVGDEHFAGPLVAALQDPEWEVRSAAAKSLGTLQLATALPALQTALADSAWWVRYNAASAIAALGDEGMRTLRHAMDNQRDAFARDISRQILDEHEALCTTELRTTEGEMS